MYNKLIIVLIISSIYLQAADKMTKNSIINASYDAALHPMTMYPIFGAVILSIKPWDHHLTKRLKNKKYVFGSEENANSKSDELKELLFYSAVLSTTFASFGNQNLNYVLAASLSYALTYNITDFGKTNVGRRRPNNFDDRSFPSIHSASSASLAAITSNNLNNTGVLSSQMRKPIQIIHYSTAAAVALARVEGGQHYVTDVLSGLAIGNFVTNFIYEVFIPQNKNSIYVDFKPFIFSKDYSLNLAINF